MKTFVIATDFSPNGNRAAHFAGHLARDQKASLILVNAYQGWPDNPAKTGDFSLSIEDTRASSEESLKRLAHKLKDELGPDMLIRCIAQEGPVRVRSAA